MMVPVAFILAFLAHSSLCFTGEELYHPGDLSDPYLYQDEYPEEPELDVRRRDASFLRFGRGGPLGRPQSDFEDYSEDFARPTRAGDKTDHFIRFGRARQDLHLRFGKRDKAANYLRFGRSVATTTSGDNGKKRNKREVFGGGKRGSADYLRFGRNSNFLRFGRKEQGVAEAAESPLVHLLTRLLAEMKKEQCKCGADA